MSPALQITLKYITLYPCPLQHSLSFRMEHKAAQGGHCAQMIAPTSFLPVQRKAMSQIPGMKHSKLLKSFKKMYVMAL